MGKGGFDSSVKNTKQGCAHFTVFALLLGVFEHSNDEDFTHDDILENEVSVELFQRFATYLTTAYSKKTDRPFAKKSAESYFTGAKEYFATKFPSNVMWKDEQWYADARSALIHNISQAAILNGDAITESAPPIGRDLLKRIMDYLLRIGTNFISKYT